MGDDDQSIWDRLHSHQQDIESLKSISARHDARIDATESRTDQMMREMAEMRGESRQHHREVTIKVAELQQAVQQGIGALRFGAYATATLIGIATVVATAMAYVVQ